MSEAARETMKVGGRYNWRNQPERLIYLGRNWSGNGYWHQFEKVDKPGTVWCEVLDSDLHRIEETQNSDGVTACAMCDAAPGAQHSPACALTHPDPRVGNAGAGVKENGNG